jgi:hypothetical protein
MSEAIVFSLLGFLGAIVFAPAADRAIAALEAGQWASALSIAGVIFGLLLTAGFAALSISRRFGW